MFFARAAATAYIFSLYALLPVLPLLASIFFGKRKFLLTYTDTLRKALRHIAALREGPALHFFHDILGRVKQIPQEIQGQCVQCGNCCMNRKCVFLETVDAGKYQCGIYFSPLRKFSNCGSFPLNQYDIERYECPSYFVPNLPAKPTRWMPLHVRGEAAIPFKS